LKNNTGRFILFKYLYTEGFVKYRVNIQKTEEGHAVWVPGLPGCWSQGKTEEEALENIKDAIKDYLEAVEEVNANRDCSRIVELA
jgi:predicted RNase H-like HicB family nuclease